MINLKEDEERIDVGREITFIIIGNAFDLQDADFACYMSIDPDDMGVKTMSLAKNS